MKLSMKKLIAIIMFALSAVGITLVVVYAVMAGSSDHKSATEGVVYVQTDEGRGSGFCVGNVGAKPKYVVTNCHVVSNYTACYVAFNLAKNDYVTARVVFRDAEKDIAVIELPEATDKRISLSLTPTAKVDTGDEVWALGFPAIADDITSLQAYDVSDVVVTRGVISRKTAAENSGLTSQLLQTDAAIHGGNSGGPLVDDHGGVVGINTLSRTDSETVNYAIQADEIVKILKAEEIPYTLTNGNAWMLILGIVLCACAAVGVVMLILDKQQMQTSAAGSPGGAMPPITVGGVGNNVNQIPQGGGNMGQPVLKCTRGKYAGQSFNLSMGRITIGRNPQLCQVVFESADGGISGNHCSVWYDPSAAAFMLTDNGSSYGTFMAATQQKLMPNVPVRLNPGDTFFLANKNQTFTVGME